MTFRTVEELRQAFLLRGGFKNSTVWDLPSFIELLNSSLKEVWRLLAETWQDYFLHENTDYETEDGTEASRLPADFWRLRMVEIAETEPAGKEYRKLRRMGLVELNQYRRLSGDPVGYHLRGQPLYPDYLATLFEDPGPVQEPQLILAPTPSSVRTLRITYIPAARTIRAPTDNDDPDTADVSEFRLDFIIGYDKLLLELCLYDAYKRSKMPVIECQQEIARLIQDLKSTAPNWDAAEPETIAQFVQSSGPLDLEPC